MLKELTVKSLIIEKYSSESDKENVKIYTDRIFGKKFTPKN